MKRILALALLSAPLGAEPLSLSGTALNPDGTPKSGVSVRLASGGPESVTDASGNWALTGGSIGIDRHGSKHQVAAGHLMVQGGRLHVMWQGKDISGRQVQMQGMGDASVTKALVRAQGGTDTVLYAFGGKIILRDTVSQSRTGIVRILDTTLNAALLYGWVVDARDGQSYRIVRIGSQTWMAENLHYSRGGAVGMCYGGINALCDQYGRWYTWAEALDVDAAYNDRRLGSIPPVRGLCPEGWHIPSRVEWGVLLDSTYLLADSSIVTTTRSSMDFKSNSGWSSYKEKDGNGMDIYGFHALPAGELWSFQSDSAGYAGWDGMGSQTLFWGSDEAADSADVVNDSTLSATDKEFCLNQTAESRIFTSGFGTYYPFSKSCRLSIRCVKN